MAYSYKSGDWNAICDVCGFKFKANQLRKRWDNLMVCNADFELPNPLMYIQVPADKPNPPWVRPEATNQFVTFCTVYTVNAVSGIGVAGCAVSGKDNGFRL